MKPRMDIFVNGTDFVHRQNTMLDISVVYTKPHTYYFITDLSNSVNEK